VHPEKVVATQYDTPGCRATVAEAAKYEQTTGCATRYNTITQECGLVNDLKGKFTKAVLTDRCVSTSHCRADGQEPFAGKATFGPITEDGAGYRDIWMDWGEGGNGSTLSAAGRSEGSENAIFRNV
jgi:hypothetical protein